MKLNRKLLMVLALVLSVAMATSGTMAYLSDTDSDVNVMTLGSVEIEQIEQEWNGDKLQDFTQAKPLYPAVSKDAEITGNSDDYPQLNAANVVDKYVSVKNTGKSDAYVRTVFAFEAGAYNTIEEFKKVIGYTYNNADWTWSEEPIKAEIKGQNYFIVEAIHKEAVKAGESTVPSLQQIYMDKDCDNEHVTGIDGNGSGTYDVLVVSQAVQTAGFADAVTALDAGFGDITATSHPWVGNNDDDDPSMSFITVKDAAELQTALDNAIDGTTILLGADITGEVTATQKAGVKVTIEGANHKFAGIITVDGKSKTYTTAGLNIKNINFKADSISEDACINLGKSGDNNTRYTCNVTVENCTFDVPGAVGVKSYTGGDKNVTIINSTATDKAHSLCQLKGVDGVLIENCTVNSKNGMNFNNSDNVVVKGCTANVKGYAVRFGESSGGVGAAETYRIENSTLKSANEDNDATIILRGTADYATLTLVNNTIVGDPAIYNPANAKIEPSDPEVLSEVSKADELIEALEGKKDVLFTEDIKIEPANMSNAYGTTGINVKNGQTIDGGGHVLDIKGAGGTWDSGINTTGGVIKNLTVTGSFRGIFINHNSTHSETVVLENVTIDGTTYTISCDQGMKQNLEAYNSTFNGWTSYAATLGTAKFVDCKFGEGNGYAFCRPYAPTEFVGCEFETGFKVDPRAVVTFENCKLDGVAITAENLATLVTSNIANATVK